MQFEKQKPRENPKPGISPSICYLLADLGTQQKKYQGVVQGMVRKLWVGFELPKQRTSDGRPFVVGNEFSMSLGKKALLPPFIFDWIGETPTETFDFKKLLQRPAMLTLTQSAPNTDGIVYINLDKAFAYEGEPMTLENKAVFFDLDNFNKVAFDSLPQFLQEKIKISPEYNELMNKNNYPDKPTTPTAGFARAADGLPSDEIPF